MNKSIDWNAEIQRLRKQSTIPKTGYFHICLLSNDAKTAYWTCTTQFAGWTESTPPREIRVASLVAPQNMIKILNNINQAPFIINNENDAMMFTILGGQAIIAENVAKNRFKMILDPDEVVSSHSPEDAKGAFQSVSYTPHTKLLHAPSPKLRMSVIKRDGYKCRIFGRSPNTNTDIELHVHHIKLFSVGGLTEMENLITLCHTCHKGLDPHYEWELFNFIGTHPISGIFKNIGKRDEYHILVSNYRKYASGVLTKLYRKKQS